MGDRLYNGLIGWWKMDDNLATSAVVDSHGGYNGVYKAGAAAQNTSTGTNVGRINRSLDFDGVNEHVSIADNAVFSPVLTPLSISAWVKMDAVASFIIASKGVIDTNGEWAFWVQAGGLLLFQAIDESQSKLGADVWIGRYFNTALTSYQGLWTHLVATYDGGLVSKGIKLYLNKKRIDNVTTEQLGLPFQGIENGNGDVHIGRYNASYSNGLIDNVKIFNIELSSAEVARLFADGRGIDKYTSFGAIRGFDRSRNRYQ